MRDKLIGQINKESGISTLEMLIALALITVSISSVISVTFGNQSVSVDIVTNNEALTKAQAIIEDVRAKSLLDYSSVVTIAPATDGLYATSSTVDPASVTQCGKDVYSTVSWPGEHNRNLSIQLRTHLGDFAEAFALGGDCNPTPPSDDWSNPTERSGLNIDKATGIDVQYHLAFLTLKKTPDTSDDLAIVDVTSSTTPILLSHVDVKKEPGFNAIDVATSTNGRLYAYIANNNPVGQLLIMDVTIPTAPFFVASSTLPGITTGVGRSIFYYDKKVYIGTQYFVCPGCNELHIYDVTVPSSPVHTASINVNRNVNAIYVHNGLAYLATGPGTSPTHNPLKIFDVDPSHVFPNPIQTYLQEVGSFTATGDEEGTAVHLLGNRLYLGLERASGGRPDFYVLNVPQPASITTFASKNLSLNSTAAVVGIRIAGNLGFLGTSDPNKNLAIFDISKTTLDDIGNFNFSQTTTGIDMADNTVYLSSYSGSRSLEIVGPTP